MRRWLVLVGKGNNGGDGLVAARHLREAGFEVGLVYAEPPAAMRGEAALQRDIAGKLGLPAFQYGDAPVRWNGYDGIIDALLGTGSRGAPRGPYAALIREANASGLPIIAADIPSGLDADTGETHDPCIRARRTVALAMLKRGLAVYPGAEAAGETVARPIGIPTALAEQVGVQTFLLDRRELTRRLMVDPLLPRRPDTHKGTYGHVLVAAGTRRMSGAGILAAKAALRAGSGLVTWALPDGLAGKAIGSVIEAMLAPVADGGRGDWAEAPPEELLALLAGKDACLIGPGMGRFPGDTDWLKTLWGAIPCPLVLDADALNMIADGDFAAWGCRSAATILTPHPGEMARLIRKPTSEVQRDRIGAARAFAREHGVILVLKGARTIVAVPQGAVYVNPTGNPGMATGGAGDVLAGAIAGLLAQGLQAGQAAALGVYLHGAAGDRAAAARRSPASLVAGDIIEYW